MLTENLNDFEKVLHPGKLLGVDFGDKRVGLAQGDSRYKMASPLRVLSYGSYKGLIGELIRIIEKEKVQGLVFGYPLNMNGTEGARCQKTRDFIQRLQGEFPVPVLLWDERLTSIKANDFLISADLSRHRRKDVIDKIAAVYILQAALDQLPSPGEK